MKRLLIIAILLLAFGTLAVAQITFGGASPPPKKEKPITSRTLVGLVTDKNDNPIPDAIVYLKDTKTLGIKSYVSQKDGSYRFNALAVNIDYEVYAQKDQKKSSTKKLSQFDGRAEPRINLSIQ